MGETVKQQQVGKSRIAYLAALTAEIRILIRAIASDPRKSLADFEMNWRENGHDITIKYPRMVELLIYTPPETEPEMLEHIGKLQLVRDGLIRLTNPATGYSIAYTNLVVGNEREKGTEGNYELARIAYGGLTRTAKWHRWLMTFLAGLAIIMALVASWESREASLGRSLLQGLEPLRAQQATLSIEKYKLDTA